MINKGISDLSSNKQEFDKLKSGYETALKDSGYFYHVLIIAILKTLKEIETERSNTQNVKTNISKVFIKLVKKHFLKSNKYNQLFNLNTLRPSYYCTINVGNIIKQHNCKVLSETNDNHNRKGNWKSKPNFPLSGGCLAECLEYKVISTTSNNSFVYYGLLKGSSKHGITTLKIVQNHDCINIIKTCAGLKRPWL